MPLGRHGITLQLEAGEVPVLFTNAAIADAEARLGKSILVVAQGFINGRSGVIEIGTLLRAGLEAGRKANKIPGKTPQLDDAYNIMDEIGMTRVAELIMPAITNVLHFGSSDPDEEDQENPN